MKNNNPLSLLNVRNNTQKPQQNNHIFSFFLNRLIWLIGIGLSFSSSVTYAEVIVIPEDNPSIVVIPNVVPNDCQTTIFHDDFNDLATNIMLGPDQGNTIRDWVISGGGPDTYAQTESEVAGNTFIYLGNGSVYKVEPPLGDDGLTFNAQGVLTKTITKITLRDGNGSSTHGNEDDNWRLPMKFSRNFTTVAGRKYRLYFKYLPENPGTNKYQPGVMRIDTPEGSVHLRTPASSEGEITYAVEFTASSTTSTIAFVNYGHITANDDCDVYTWSTCGGIPNWESGNEGALDDVSLVEANCSASTGNGTLNYANSGTGKYKDRILFMDWKDSSLEDGLQEGDVVNFTIPASTGMSGGTLKATFSNVDDTGGIAEKVIPSDMRTWGGAAFYQLYDTAGSGEAIYAKTQFNPNDENGDHHLSFDINWEMTINGQSVAPDILVLDPESTTENAESIDVSTDGGVWSIIENAVNESYIVDGVGSQQIYILDTEDENIDDDHPTSTEGAPLLLSKGATQMSVALRTINGNGGKQAIAFALLAPTDHGDAPGSYGDAAHAFKEEAISPPKNILGLKFTPGTPYFGTPPDSEFSRQEDDSPAQGDDNNDDAFDTAREDDEDIEIPPLAAGGSIDITIPVTGSGYLHAWIDWNADGDFGDANEHIASNVHVNSGNTTLTLNVPDNAEIGSSYARFRISSAQNLLSTGYAKDGEVEDVAIEITEGNVCRVDDLSNNLYSTSLVSANSNVLNDATRVYQAKFNNESWEGHILAYNLETTDNDGSVKSLQWDAADNIARTGRKLFTYNPSLASNRGRIFAEWNNLSAEQKTILRKGQTVSKGKKRFRWVKGLQNDEGSFLRARNTILGDIINSNLLFKDTFANYGYRRLPEGGDYESFLESKRNTTPALFIGANDGMLHAFNANNGHELFAYIPNEVFHKLVTISDPKYGCKTADCLPHEYLVDGKSSIGDAYFASSSDWHTVLVSGLGLGGKALFALDVSNAENFSASDVLWEISSTQASSAGSNASEFANHLGETIPSASVVRMNNSDPDKRWVAVVANGYNSASNKAVLFIIDIETGALVKKIDTGVGSADQPNGLSSPITVDSNNDSIVDRIYAGDLLGNLWAFDVSGDDSADWGVDFSGSPLFSASQAITAPPQVGRNTEDGLMVYFGTGKYFDVSDNIYDGAPVANTYYGIHDNGSPVSSDTLVEQTILQQSAADGTDYNVRVTSSHSVDFSTDHGWFMSLPDAGERVISQALLRRGRLIFTTMTPPGNICEWGGTSWLMEFDAVEGKRLGIIPLDINKDKEFTEADNVSYEDNKAIISGVQDTALGVVFSTPAVISHDTQTEGKYLTGTGGSIGMFKESASKFTGRMSWRQIR